MKEKLRYLVYFGIIISIELFCSFTLNSMGIRKENILMVFIVGVLLIATFTKGYFYGLLAAIVSVLCFNFLYIDPNYDFHISDPNDFMLILFFLMTSVIACSLTDRFQKQIIISKKNESILKKVELVSTGTTGLRVMENTNLQIYRYKSGPLGGDQQIGALVADHNVDMIIFLRDPLTSQPHEPDIMALLRLCDVYKVPLATNVESAQLLLDAINIKL